MSGWGRMPRQEGAGRGWGALEQKQKITYKLIYSIKYLQSHLDLILPCVCGGTFLYLDGDQMTK